MERARQARRRAVARRAMRSELRRSRLRYWGRGALAAALVAPVGLLGMLTTPIGRRLGWSGLMYPGRRLWWRLMGRAREERADRDQRARQEFEKRQHADPDDGGRRLLDRVPRAPRNHTALDWADLTKGDDMADTSTPGFLFDASASEMEEAAGAYEPDGAMHVISTLAGMPAALTSISNTFKILAEKSDEEFPLDKIVGEGLEEVYRHLKRAVDAAEEVAETAQQVHEHDIRRHEEPRTGEAMWDTTNNQDN
ncbi:hypothetical protein OG946_31235 [Streptomyces sp. NBC_01808]|uniref:hypothetical protein n=1 Tax=Streptomyces sp. NBC_01808 TaxID=2975947 RepID=UPI002DD8FD96|nr:hypothetical protein [Streptomyces sp. NBC_01808]WSA41466.1 hypothetical protein OG946_31235 [Streptomyces sp. NBC_01808]